MTDHDWNHRCLIEKNVPIAVILPNRWQDGAESLVIEYTSCRWRMFRYCKLLKDEIKERWVVANVSIKRNNLTTTKSVDGVLGIQTQHCKMVSADESTELWRSPFNIQFFVYFLGSRWLCFGWMEWEMAKWCDSKIGQIAQTSKPQKTDENFTKNGSRGQFVCLFLCLHFYLFFALLVYSTFSVIVLVSRKQCWKGVPRTAFER